MAGIVGIVTVGLFCADAMDVGAAGAGVTAGATATFGDGLVAEP